MRVRNQQSARAIDIVAARTHRAFREVLRTYHATLAWRALDLLELRQHLFGEADHRLLIVWGREAGDQVAVADL